MNEQTIAVLLLGLVIWLVIRRAGQKRREGAAGGRVGGSSSTAAQDLRRQREMPRAGVPGTITEGQIDQLQANGFEPSTTWSFEEAALVLDATTYQRAAILNVTGDNNPPVDIQNTLIQFILSDEELRDYVRGWGKRRREEGRDDEPPKLRANNQLRRIEEKIDALREDATS